VDVCTTATVLAPFGGMKTGATDGGVVVGASCGRHSESLIVKNAASRLC
jgi:hypothetical protein